MYSSKLTKLSDLTTSTGWLEPALANRLRIDNWSTRTFWLIVAALNHLIGTIRVRHQSTSRCFQWHHSTFKCFYICNDWVNHITLAPSYSLLYSMYISWQPQMCSLSIVYVWFSKMVCIVKQNYSLKSNSFCTELLMHEPQIKALVFAIFLIYIYNTSLYLITRCTCTCMYEKPHLC